MSKKNIEEIKETPVNKYTKKQIVESNKYREFYVLLELLKDNEEYSIEEIENLLKPYK